MSPHFRHSRPIPRVRSCHRRERWAASASGRMPITSCLYLVICGGQAPAQQLDRAVLEDVPDGLRKKALGVAHPDGLPVPETQDAVPQGRGPELSLAALQDRRNRLAQQRRDLDQGARLFVEALTGLRGVSACTVAGSIRRKSPLVGELHRPVHASARDQPLSPA